MRSRVCARTITILAVATGAYVLPVAPGSTLTGVGSAEAAAFYTRKRVNGRWITGQFPKAATRVTRASSTSRFAKKGRRVVEEFAVAAAPQPPARERTLSRTVALPQRTEPMAAPETPKQITQPQLVSLQPPAEFSEERMAKLRRALQARADELAAAQTASVTGRAVSVGAATLRSGQIEAVPATTSAPDAMSSVSGPLRQAPLEAATAAASAPPAKAAWANPLEPKSVSYDFETGIKTTVFENSVVREPFDVSALKGMTGRLPPLR